MKVLVIGGVAAGTKAAAKLKREDRSIDVKIITGGHDISYAGCGLPYYIGDVITSRDELIVNTPEKFSALTGVEVITDALVAEVDFKKKSLSYIKGSSNVIEETYDKLIIATGASPIVPNIPGYELDGVFTLRTPDDADAIKAYAKRDDVGSAVIAGAGFIGLEVAENLKRIGTFDTVEDFWR